MREYERAVEPLYRRRAKADVATTRGRIALSEGRWQEAVARFREAANDGTGSPLTMPDLARAYLATPDPMRSTTDATELARTYRRLGELYERHGEIGKARESYRRFIELWKDCDPDLRPQVAKVQRRLRDLQVAK